MPHLNTSLSTLLSTQYMLTIALPTYTQRSMLYNSFKVALLSTVLCTQFPAVVIPHLIRAQQRGVKHISKAIHKEI